MNVFTIRYSFLAPHDEALEDHVACFACACRLAVWSVHGLLPWSFDRDAYGIRLMGVPEDSWYDAYHLLLGAAMAIRFDKFSRFSTDRTVRIVRIWERNHLRNATQQLHRVHEGRAKARGEAPLSFDGYKSVLSTMLGYDRSDLVRSAPFEEVVRRIAGHMLAHEDDHSLSASIRSLTDDISRLVPRAGTHAEMFREVSEGPIPGYARQADAQAARNGWRGSRELLQRPRLRTL